MKSIKNGPAPQLARPVYTLPGSDSDSDSDDSDDDSLEITPPVNPRNMNDTSIMNAATSASLATVKPAPSPTAKTSTAKLLSMNFSDSDSDDDIMKKYNLQRKQPLARQRSNLSQSSSNKYTSRTKKVTAANKPTTKPRSSPAKSRMSAAEKEEKQRERERIREAKAQQKKAEQAARAKQRAVEKENRDRKKQQEKDSKKRQREEFQQISGKFCNQEIALLIDLPVYLDDEMELTNSVLSEDFLLKPQPVAYKIPNSIQWIRKDYLKGGAKDAVEQLEQKQVQNFERSPYLLILMTADEFLPLLDREGHEVDDDYPALEEFIVELQAKYRRMWKNTEDPRIMLLLREVPETLDKMWKNKTGKSKRQNGNSLPTDYELGDAIQWLLIQFQVEVIHCPSIESIQLNLHKLTRGICEAPYKNQVTELECIKKLKSTNTGERPIDIAQDAWFRQLQQIPQVSEGIALNAVKSYPTLHSLWQSYNYNNDPGTNADLMINCLAENRGLSKLSHSIYRILKSDNPREKLT